MLTIDSSIFYFILAGFLAELVDGALGMAYGVISTSILIYIGIPVTRANISVKFSEIFITLVSGFSHFKFGNIDKILFKKLLISGIIGGIVGAYILSSLPGEKIKPFVAIYLIIMGIIILARSFKNFQYKKITSKIKVLGFVGGFFDAIGGGGWGPILTSTLIARGNSPQKTIGTVNSVEFFVTVSQSIVFILSIGFGFWKIILGLTIGGVIAAPISAYLCKIISAKYLLVLIGILLIIINSFSFLK